MVRSCCRLFAVLAVGSALVAPALPLRAGAAECCCAGGATGSASCRTEPADGLLAAGCPCQWQSATASGSLPLPALPADTHRAQDLTQACRLEASTGWALAPRRFHDGRPLLTVSTGPPGKRAPAFLLFECPLF